MNLAQELADAEARVERVKREMASATCAEVGHLWISLGGCNCGCVDGACSVPVNECARCKDCDYGDNLDADKTRARCAELKGQHP